MVLKGYPTEPVRTGFNQLFIGSSKIPKIHNCELNWYCNCCNCNRRSCPNRLQSGLVHWFWAVRWTGLSNTMHLDCYPALFLEQVQPTQLAMIWQSD